MKLVFTKVVGRVCSRDIFSSIKLLFAPTEVAPCWHINFTFQTKKIGYICLKFGGLHQSGTTFWPPAKYCVGPPFAARTALTCLLLPPVPILMLTCPLLVFLALHSGQHGRSDWSPAVHPHTQKTLIHCLFWHLSTVSIRTICWIGPHGPSFAHHLHHWASTAHDLVSG